MNGEQSLRQEVVRIGKLMHQFGLIDGSAGNLSVRLDPTRILTTPSGLPKGLLTPEQLIVVDLQGKLSGPQMPAAQQLRPTSELLMHLEVYHRRPDVNAVVHAHPITTIALTVAGIPLTNCIIPEAIVFLGPVPTTPYATPSGAENQQAIAGLIENHDAIVLAHHGSLTVGATLLDAYQRLETLEHSAKIIAMAHLLGGAATLPSEQVMKLVDIRQRLDLARPGDPENFCQYCGVCHPQGQHNNPDAHIAAITAQVHQALANI